MVKTLDISGLMILYRWYDTCRCQKYSISFVVAGLCFSVPKGQAPPPRSHSSFFGSNLIYKCRECFTKHINVMRVSVYNIYVEFNYYVEQMCKSSHDF